jgi:fumarylpyruvate hydrolase
MNQYVVEAPKLPAIPVMGSDATFPVRRVYCVGRNYVAHVREMGGNEDRDPPLFFQKPADSLVLDGGTVPYPTITKDFHFEVELVLAMKGGGLNIPQDKALDHIYGYAVGIDMTRRDIQGGGRPWEIAKSFDHSFPCGAIAPAAEVGHIQSGQIELTVNGETRQNSDVELLIWKIPEIIANLSTYFKLMPGDVIMTGTPHGVGPVKPGDRIEARVDKLPELHVTVGAPLA